VDLVLERFADKTWKDVEKDWAEGRIGSRECLSRQIGLVQATPEQIREAVADVQLDPYFVPFLKKAEELGVLVTIVSDGFDLLIEQILKQNLHEAKPALLKGLPIYSNRLQKTPEGYKALFPMEDACAHDCANCKLTVIKKTTTLDDYVFFVGDGLSDRYAARHAHLTFAKGKLLKYCEDNQIDHIPYKNFKKVEDWMVENLPLLRKMRDGRR
jgi:2,3-diketo-5-methylthio-1-phosphopentane phosphatase